MRTSYVHAPLVGGHFQAFHHGGPTETSEQAEDGDGHPSHDEQDKGEHVGDVVALECVVI